MSAESQPNELVPAHLDTLPLLTSARDEFRSPRISATVPSAPKINGTTSSFTGIFLGVFDFDLSVDSIGPRWQVYHNAGKLRYTRPMHWSQHPQFPWILWAEHPAGGWALHDTRDGAQIHATTPGAFQAFLADRSNPNLRAMGLGDVVHAAADAIGLQRCTPCAQRQQALNRLVPNIWQR